MENNRPYTFDRTVRLLIGLGVCVILFMLTNKLSSVLLPFLISWLIAYMLHPMVKFFQYKLHFRNRVLSIISTLVSVGAVVTGATFVIVPIIAKEINKVRDLTTTYMGEFDIDSIIPITWQSELADFFTRLDIEALLRNDDIMTAVKQLLPQLWDILGNSIDFIMSLAVLFVCLLYVFFILMDFEKIYVGWREIIPQKHKKLIIGLADDLEQGMNSYFRGQALVAFLVGIGFSIGFCITGLPLAILIGMFIGLLNMVPYLQIIGIFPCILLGLLQSLETGTDFWIILLGIAIVFGVVQSIQDFVLVPKIMGKITGLKPAIILLALSIWGSLLGIIGMIIALPMTTLMISYYRRLVLHQDTNKEVEDA